MTRRFRRAKIHCNLLSDCYLQDNNLTMIPVKFELEGTVGDIFITIEIRQIFKEIARISVAKIMSIKLFFTYLPY